MSLLLNHFVGLWREIAEHYRGGAVYIRGYAHPEYDHIHYPIPEKEYYPDYSDIYETWEDRAHISLVTFTFKLEEY